MTQNYGTKLITFLSALLSFIVVFITVYLFFHHFWKSIIVATIIFIVVYSIVLYYIKEILEKKIQTIYKFINQTKAGKKESFYNENILPRPSLIDLSKDVENWALSNQTKFTLLEKNEQYRREFLQNLSHELKTPLFSIQGYIESLQNGALHDNSVNEKFLNNSANNVKRLIDIINDLDAITKLESDQSKLQLKTFNISDLIQNVFALNDKKAKEKNIKLAFKQNSLQNKKVIADETKIFQVLTNLIENAIKYGKENGSVIANIDKLDNDLVLIEITDNGHGIAQEHLDRIFERFYRTDLARNRNIGGSGLGLAICKHIIEAHQQTIHVRSQINVGTTFRFTLQKA